MFMSKNNTQFFKIMCTKNIKKKVLSNMNKVEKRSLMNKE